MVIDEDMYRKKLYRGPFFEIYYETSLKSSKKLNQHSQDISKGTMEEICFRSICTILNKSKHNVLHFDDNSQSQPDAYSRNNKKVMMVEYKDYIFKEEIISEGDFDKTKNYIDEKFSFCQIKVKRKGLPNWSIKLDYYTKRNLNLTRF